MNIDMLLIGYEENNIQVEETNHEDEGKATVIKFEGDIAAAVLSNELDNIISINIFSSAITTKDKTATNQIDHTINLLKIINNTIKIIAKAEEHDINMIFTMLGLFDGTFINNKSLFHENFLYGVEVNSGMIIFKISKTVMGVDYNNE